MIHIDPRDATIPEVHGLLLGGVAPRPIALVSTISDDGVMNLSPFSFFNAFGANPPYVAFSPSRRGKDNTVKDTYNNLMSNKECVIQAVTYSMVDQINLASCEYEFGVNEFTKAGFTALDSDLVKPKRVAESPFQMECRLRDMIHLGGKEGSGNLAVCEVVKFHVSEYIMTDGRIDPSKFDHVGRNGAAYYTRASGHALFEVEKPGLRKGIGFDGLPDYILNSNVFTANNLAKLALNDYIPEGLEAKEFIATIEPIEANDHTFENYYRMNDYKNMLRSALYMIKNGHPRAIGLLEKTAKCALENGNMDFAWKVAVHRGINF